MLIALANRLERTQSDTVRLLVREAAQGLAQSTVESLTDECAADYPTTAQARAEQAVEL